MDNDTGPMKTDYARRQAGLGETEVIRWQNVVHKLMETAFTLSIHDEVLMRGITTDYNLPIFPRLIHRKDLES